MAVHKQLIGAVVGAQGTRWFYVTAATSTAPPEARVGDIVVNGGTSTFMIGTRSLGVGQFSRITGLDPFILQASPFGNIRGVQGATGAASTVPGPPGADGRNGYGSINRWQFAVGYGYDAYYWDTHGFDHEQIPSEISLGKILYLQVFGELSNGVKFAEIVPVFQPSQVWGADYMFARKDFVVDGMTGFSLWFDQLQQGTHDFGLVMSSPPGIELFIYFIDLVYWV